MRWGPHRYFAQWHYARRRMLVVRISGAAEANVVCVLLGTAGIRACATGADVRGDFWVTVPAMQLAAARRLVPG